jgi:hypothetical protein
VQTKPCPKKDPLKTKSSFLFHVTKLNKKDLRIFFNGKIFLINSVAYIKVVPDSLGVGFKGGIYETCLEKSKIEFIQELLLYSFDLVPLIYSPEQSTLWVAKFEEKLIKNLLKMKRDFEREAGVSGGILATFLENKIFEVFDRIKKRVQSLGFHPTLGEIFKNFLLLDSEENFIQNSQFCDKSLTKRFIERKKREALLSPSSSDDV